MRIKSLVALLFWILESDDVTGKRSIVFYLDFWFSSCVLVQGDSNWNHLDSILCLMVQLEIRHSFLVVSRKSMVDKGHSLTVTVGSMSATVDTPSASLALATVGMVCATRITVEYIKS